MQIQQEHRESASTGKQLSGRPPTVRALESHGMYRIGLAYGRLVHRFRWIILAIWIIGVAASVPFAMKVTSALSGGGYAYSGSESVRVQNLLVDQLHQPPSQLMVVFQSSNTPVSDITYQNEIASFVDRAKTFQHVTGVTTGGIGQNQNTTFVLVNFDQDAQSVEQYIASFHELLPSGDTAGPARAYLTGSPAIYNAFTTISQQDTERAEIAALPIALVVLVIVFGTLVAAMMPILLALVAVPVALAIIYGIALHTTTSVFVVNIATIVGLGIAIDYSLFMTRRFRSELGLGRPVREAVAWTVATAGEAILFSGMTVMIGFAALILIGLPFIQSFGIGGAIVVAAAVLASLTLLPALLGVLGSRINALHVPVLGRLVVRAAHEGEERAGFWHKWAVAVMRRPLLVVLVVGALLVGLGWPVFSINIGTPSSSSLPTTSEARQGLDIVSQQFPALSGNTISVMLQTPDGSSVLTADNIARINQYSGWLAAQSHVSGVTSLTRFPGQSSITLPTGSPLDESQLETLYTTGAYQQIPALAQLVSGTTANGTTLITVQSNATLDSAPSKQLIDHLRANKAEGQGLTVLVGGIQATTLDFTTSLYSSFPQAILFIMLATYVLLLLMFRSVVLPLKAILMNVLSVGAAYGVLVYVFQWGNFESILGFQSTGMIDSFIPILMFCILFGLSMDYEVFLLSSIYEEWLRTHHNRWAVARGLEKTGGVITNAALLFIIVTGAFTFTTLIITKEMGLGMAVAVLVDAAIVRTLLVPATMRLLGRWNWWLPGRALPPKVR